MRRLSGSHTPHIYNSEYTFVSTKRYPSNGRYGRLSDSLDPPTGQDRINAGGAARTVASTRGGRQAHPPNVEKVIHKKSNKKERMIALCSAIAATASKERILRRNHFIGKFTKFPIIVQDNMESISKTSELVALLESLGISEDADRLQNRKVRTGKAALRGRTKKTGVSVLLVAKDTKNLALASGSIRGIEARDASNLSVLDLAPGGEPARLVIYSESAITEIGKLRSAHLDVMAMVQ